MMRDIHALAPPISRSSNRSSSLSMASSSSSENFTTISRRAGVQTSKPWSSPDPESDRKITRVRVIIIWGGPEFARGNQSLGHRAGYPLRSPPRPTSGGGGGGVLIERVKKEEAESKISAWQNGKIATVNNRFKREEVVISGWEDKQLQKANSWMNKVERFHIVPAIDTVADALNTTKDMVTNALNATKAAVG